MVEDILFQISSFIPSAPGQASLPPESLPLSYICSGLGAIVLGKFTGSIGAITMPLNTAALFIGVILANWLLGGIDLPMDHQLQQPLLVTLIGMMLAAFAMMWWLKNETAYS